MSTKKYEGVELTPRLAENQVENAREILQEATSELRTAPPPDRREQLLEALKGIKSVRFNSSREIIFSIRSNWVDNRSRIIFHLDRRRPTATFGQEDVPALEALPTHALEAIWRGLQLGSLVDTSDSAPVTQPPDYRPLSGSARVSKGLDPVKACSETSEMLHELLKGPSRVDHKDPEGAILEQIRNRYHGEYKVLVALQYLEQCGRRRPRILTTLEDWIQECHEKRGVTLES